MIVGRSRAPIKFILLTLERIAKTPRDVAVIKISKPWKLDRTMLTNNRMIKIAKERIE